MFGLFSSAFLPPVVHKVVKLGNIFILTITEYFCIIIVIIFNLLVMKSEISLQAIALVRPAFFVETFPVLFMRNKEGLK